MHLMVLITHVQADMGPNGVSASNSECK